MDTLYTFWDNITHYKAERVHFGGLMNSATKLGTPKDISISMLQVQAGSQSAYKTCLDREHREVVADP